MWLPAHRTLTYNPNGLWAPALRMGIDPIYIPVTGEQPCQQLHVAFTTVGREGIEPTTSG